MCIVHNIHTHIILYITKTYTHTTINLVVFYDSIGFKTTFAILYYPPKDHLLITSYIIVPNISQLKAWNYGSSVHNVQHRMKAKKEIVFIYFIIAEMFSKMY